MLNKIHIYHYGRFNKLSDSKSVRNIPDGAVLVDGFLSKSEDVTSHNGYRYEPEFWGRVTKNKDFVDRLKAREMLGCIEHPESDDDYLYTPYDKAALIVLDVTMKGTDPFGVLGLLNNNEGTFLKSIVEFGSRIGVSTRGVGSTKLNGASDKVVDSEGYSVITWDSVRNPNLPVTLGAISDAMLNSARFKEMFDTVKLRDSGSGGFNRHSMDKDILKMRDEAQAYLASVVDVKKKLISDGQLFIKAKADYDKYISSGGSHEGLMKLANSRPLAYAYLCSL